MSLFLSAFCVQGWTFVFLAGASSILPDVRNASGSYFIASRSTSNFSNQTLSCLDPTCHIVCNQEAFCQDMRIDAHNSTDLVLDCLVPYSCSSSISVTSSNLSASVHISCKEQLACDHTSFNMGDSIKRLELSCNSPSNTSSNTSMSKLYSKGACFGMTLSNVETDILAVSCGSYDCYQATFIAGASKAANIVMAGNAAFNATIVATDVTSSLVLQCGNESSCLSSTLFCPNNAACVIECTDDESGNASCLDNKIMVPFARYDLDLECESANTCNATEIRCLDTELISKVVFRDSTDAYECDTNACCPLMTFRSTTSVPAKIITSDVATTLSEVHVDTEDDKLFVRGLMGLVMGVLCVISIAWWSYANKQNSMRMKLLAISMPNDTAYIDTHEPPLIEVEETSTYLRVPSPRQK